MNTESTNPPHIPTVLSSYFRSVPQKLLVELILEKAGDQEIEISEEEAAIVAELFWFKNDDNEVEAYDSAKIDVLVKMRLVDSQQAFLDEMESRTRGFLQLLPQHMEKLQSKTTDDYLEFADRRWPQASQEIATERQRFRTDLYKTWSEPFEKFRMLREICFKFGSDYVKCLRKRPPAGKKSLREVMVVAHSRACQIADEILYLMEGGYADGALALSRSLHELAVISMFISTHGEETARRFLAHRVVDLKSDERHYHDFLKRKGEHVGEWRDNPVFLKFQEVIDEFGKGFKKDYGWAADALGGERRITFYAIEKNIFEDNETNNMRYFYQLANRSIHVRPVNLYSRAGIPADQPMLLAGPSNIGFSDPGRWAAVSLAMTTINLFSVSEPSEDELLGETDFRFAVALSVVRRCLENTIASFDATQERLDLRAAEEERKDD